MNGPLAKIRRAEGIVAPAAHADTGLVSIGTDRCVSLQWEQWHKRTDPSVPVLGAGFGTDILEDPEPEIVGMRLCRGVHRSAISGFYGLNLEIQFCASWSSVCNA